MHRLRGVQDQSHHVLLRYPLLVAAGDKGNSRAMKAKMAETYPLMKKLPPQAARLGWHLECHFTALAQESPQEWPKSRTEWHASYGFFVTFRAEPKRVAGEVHIAQREAGLAKSAALFPGNFVAHPHPLRFSFQRPGDKTMLLWRDLRFKFRLLSLDPEFEAWVRRRKSGFDRFVHDDAEELYFEQGGVFCGFARAFFTIGALPPFDEITYLLPCQLSRDGDLVFAQERFDVSPGGERAPLRCSRSCVALCEESGYPRLPELASAGFRRAVELTARQLLREPPGLARLVLQVITKAGRFLTSLARRVLVLDPPERRESASVKRSHCRAL